MVSSDKMNWKGGSLTPFTHSFSFFRAVILGHVISILDLDCSHEMMKVSRKWMSVFLISRTCEHICYFISFALSVALRNFDTHTHTLCRWFVLYFLFFSSSTYFFFFGFYYEKIACENNLWTKFLPSENFSNCFRW